MVPRAPSISTISPKKQTDNCIRKQDQLMQKLQMKFRNRSRIQTAVHFETVILIGAYVNDVTLWVISIQFQLFIANP